MILFHDFRPCAYINMILGAFDMAEICKLCKCDPEHPKKLKVPVKGGRKVGVLNGDVKLKCYIDINGHFIGKDGLALDENGDVLVDKNGCPVVADVPSWIPIGEYRPDTHPWTSEVELERLQRKYKQPGREPKSLLPIDYAKIFNIRLNASDEEYLYTNVLFKLNLDIGRLIPKTVEIFHLGVYRK